MSMLITDKEKLKEYTSENRLWEGVPGIEKTKKGRLFCSFFSGQTGEAIGNFTALIKSDDNGKTWSEPILVTYLEGLERCFDPCLWMAPDGKLWFLWAVRHMGIEGRPLETYATYTENPDAEEISWCEPFLMGPGVAINKPLVCSDGDIVFSISSWAHELDKTLDVYRSADNGMTRKKIGQVKAPGMYFGEQIVVEHDDMSLSMYLRTTYGISVSHSYDGGCTWTKEEATELGGPCSRFFMKKLKSGKLLLVNHYNFDKRNNLTAMLSDDDGKTWYGYLLLDGRDNVSYPDAIEDADGKIYIIYDRNRGGGLHSLEEVLSVDREILLAVVREEDIAAGKPVTKDCKLQRIVHKLGDYAGKNKNPYDEFEKYSESEYIEMLCNMKSSEEISERILTDYAYKCVNISVDLIKYIDDLFEQLENAEEMEDPIKRKYLINKIVAAVKQIKTGNDHVPTEEIIGKIFNSISAHLTEDISLDEMAKELSISKYYMCYLFKSKTGTSVVSYKNYQRITLAKKYLRYSAMPITEIGLKVGFWDASYFAKWFKKIEGITPTEFRKNNSMEA